MPIITFNGQSGSVRELGLEVAQTMGLDYVDRLILAEAGKRVGVPVATLAEKEQRPETLGDRLSRTIQRVLERSALAGAGGDPYFGAGVDALLLQPYPDTSQPLTRAQELDDQRFFEVISGVVKDLAKTGNVVIIGRGSNLILKDMPGSLHVGTVAPLQYRTKVIMEREHLDAAAAEKYIMNAEKVRLAFYKRHFKANLDEPMAYHVVFNTAKANKQLLAQIVAQMAAAIEIGS